MSRSLESDAPMALSCSRRWPRSSAAVGAAPPAKRRLWVVSSMTLFNAHRAHFLDLGDAVQALFHAVLLQRSHAVFEALGKDFGHPGVLLDHLFQPVGGDQ